LSRCSTPGATEKPSTALAGRIQATIAALRRRYDRARRCAALQTREQAIRPAVRFRKTSGNHRCVCPCNQHSHPTPSLSRPRLGGKLLTGRQNQTVGIAAGV